MLINYNDSLVNLISSILKYFGAEYNYSTLKEIDKLLEDQYRNVVIAIKDKGIEYTRSPMQFASHHAGLTEKEMIIPLIAVYETVRQVILLTEDTEKTINFYRKNGMIKTSDYNCISFMK